jgi:hypothetical protein
MKPTNESPIEGQKNPAPPQSTPPLRRRVLHVCVVILAFTMVSALSLFRIYGADTHHASRSGIWWPERGRNLIPPTATDITLRRDLLDHYAIYTISEKDLNAFLDKRFARDGKTLDSFSERSPANPKKIGKAIGPLGWMVTKDTVEYTYCASNGGAHNYYHDTKTGRTYQDSAYW